MEGAASALFRAMDGMGTDENAIHTALRGKSAAEVAELRRIYADHYGRSLDTDLEGELSGTDLAAAKAALSSDPVVAAAATLQNAASGLGTDEEAIQRTLEGITDPKQRSAVADEFHRRTGRSLDAMLKDELSGADLDTTRRLAAGDVAGARAARLDNAMNGGFLGLGLGTDEEAIYKTLESCATPEERQQLVEAYRQRTGRDLSADMTDEMGGGELDVATSLASGDRAGAAAARIAVATKGIGTDEHAIFRQLEGQPKEVREAIIRSYNERYGQQSGGLDFDKMLGSELGTLDAERARQHATQDRLDPAFAMRYAMSGLGTDEDMVRQSLQGLSKEQVDELRGSYKQRYGRDLDREISGETSGRDGFEIRQMMLGKPQTPEESLARMNAAYDFERGSGAGLFGNAVTDLFSNSGRVLDEQHRRVEGLGERIRAGSATAEDLERLQTIGRYHQDDVVGVQASRDAIANGAALGATAVVGTAATIMTGGAVGPAAAAAIGALAGGAGGMAVKAGMQGASYATEDIATDAAMALVTTGSAGLVQGSVVNAGISHLLRGHGAVAQHVGSAAMRGGGMGLVSGTAAGALDEQTWRGPGNGVENFLSHAAKQTIGGAAAMAGAGQFAIRAPHAATATRQIAAGGATGAAGGAVGSVLRSAVDPATWEGRWEDVLLNFGQNAVLDSFQGALEGAAQTRRDLRHNAAADPAKALHVAMDGLGNDTALMREALRGTTPEQANEIRARYHQLYKRDLDQDMKERLSGREGRNIRLMLPQEPGPMFGTPEFEAALDKATNSTSRGGNDVKMLFDGVESFPERANVIDGASKSVDVQTFVFKDDDTGWNTAMQLAQKAQQGVKVRFLYDVMGSTHSTEIYEFMRKAGVDVRGYGNPLEEPLKINNRWHEKHIVADGAVSIEGGMNIADEYALGGTDKPVNTNTGRAWRDVDARVRGPAAADSEAAFIKNWNEVRPEGAPIEGPTLADAQAGGDTNVRVVRHQPKQDNNVESLYLQALRSSRNQITIENAYFVPSEEFRFELMAAVKRGVDVRVLTNSRETHDNWPVADASRRQYDELLAAGVNIEERHHSTLHAKTATFDGEYSIVGSANLNGRSRNQDTEVVLGIGGRRAAAELENRYNTRDHTQPVSREELEGESASVKARAAIVSAFDWML